MQKIIASMVRGMIEVGICIIQMIASLLELVGAIFDLASWVFHAGCDGLLKLGDCLGRWHPFKHEGKYIEKT